MEVKREGRRDSGDKDAWRERGIVKREGGRREDSGDKEEGRKRGRIVEIKRKGGREGG